MIDIQYAAEAFLYERVTFFHSTIPAKFRSIGFGGSLRSAPG